jgi:hypothetical protein
VTLYATERLPQPMAVNGETTHDPATRSVLVKVSGVGASFWRRGHAAMMQAEESGRYWGAPSVYAHAPDRREIARGGGRLRSWGVNATRYSFLAWPLVLEAGG